jgi:RNA polymerase-binding transcription factor DksA
MANIETRKSQLETRLGELKDRLLNIEDVLDDQPSTDVEDRASEREDDEVLEKLGLSGQKEIQMIEAALRRVEAGTYGDCAKCGDTIAEERLDLLPYTPLCRNCAA